MSLSVDDAAMWLFRHDEYLKTHGKKDLDVGALYPDVAGQLREVQRAKVLGVFQIDLAKLWVRDPHNAQRINVEELFPELKGEPTGRARIVEARVREHEARQVTQAAQTQRPPAPKKEPLPERVPSADIQQWLFHPAEYFMAHDKDLNVAELYPELLGKPPEEQRKEIIAIYRVSLAKAWLLQQRFARLPGVSGSQGIDIVQIFPGLKDKPDATREDLVTKYVEGK